MKTLAVLLIVLAVAHGYTEFEYVSLFRAWMAQYNKVYDSQEFAARFSTFKNNLKLIDAANAANTEFELGINAFGDLTLEEFTAQFTGMIPIEAPYARSLNAPTSVVDPPAETDWIAAGAVTPIKNQGQCGSCWAFSAVGSLEGLTKIHGGQLVSLSEQQLVDCSREEGNEGCNGGLMDQAFQYVIKHGGLCSEADYPYKGIDDTCKDTQCKSVPSSAITSFKDVTKNSEDALKAAVAQQPVSVGVDASSVLWQFYRHGVFSGACGTQLDHGVLAVGYGQETSVFKLKFWHIKNSWGTSWGEKGYMRMKREDGSGKPGHCGIAMMASYPSF